MRKRKTLREAFDQQRPLLSPLAHDGLSARLIEMAGFKSFSVGGSALLAARHALPDIGLAGLGDMEGGIRDIAAASALPFMADADDGYGDVKSVVRTVLAYEALGVGGFLLEDQVRTGKQQRAEKARAVMEESEICAKLRAALMARDDTETLVIGRTDAYGVFGLDAAIRRAERFLNLGVDGIFIAGLRTEQDYETVGRCFDGTLLLAAMFEGGDTPWITPRVLGEMGYKQVSFPVSVLLRVVKAIQQGLAFIQSIDGQPVQVPKLEDAQETIGSLNEAVNLKRWDQIMIDSRVDQSNWQVNLP